MPKGQWFSEPLSGVFELEQRRRVIDWISGAAICSVVVAFPYSLMALGADDWFRWIGFVVALAGFSSAPVLVRRTGRVATGALALLCTGVALIVISASYGEGVEVIFVVWFLMVPLLAGLFVGPRAAWVFGLLGVAFTTAMYLVSHVSGTPEPVYGLGSFLVWLNLTLAIGFSATVGAVASKALDDSRKRVQEDAERLGESLERYQGIFETALDPMVTIGEDGMIVEFNPAAEVAFGHERSAVLNQPLASLLIPERMREAHEVAFQRFLETGEGSVVGQRVELEALRADGSEFPIELTVRSLVLSGRVHCTAQIRDLTEHYRAQAKLSEAERRISQTQRLESLGRLAGGVAHDFNNLLTAINGYTELLLQKQGLEEEVRESLVQIGKAGAQAGKVTQQLLAFSRADQVVESATDVNAAIRDLFALFRRFFPESINISMDLATDLWSVKSGGEPLEQVLQNLVLNAGDAMPDGGDLRLTTRNRTFSSVEGANAFALPDGDYVEIVVEDTGQGMDESTMHHVFDPFFTTKSTGEGTGLGLWTAYGSVRRSGGTIEVSSEPGEGTVFTLLVPRAIDPQTTPAEEDAPVTTSQGETVLVIEDQASLRKLLRQSLELKGYRVLLATDGVDAIERYSGGRADFDLVITDVVMPRLGGLATVERLRESRGDLRVILMSGYSGDATDELRAREAELPFLKKPFSLNALQEKVHEVLGH